MQIRVNIDRAAALRRGLDTHGSTVVLSVDPAALEQADRDLLANAVGDYRATSDDSGVIYLAQVSAIEEATVEALLARLRAAAQRAAAENAAKEAKRLAYRAECDEVVRERRTKQVQSSTHRLAVAYPVPHWPPDWAGSYHAEREAALAAAPEWASELEAAETAARAAEQAACAEEKERAAREVAERAAARDRGREVLRNWAAQHGSELLRARLAHEPDGAKWDALAEDEWVEQILAPVTLPLAETPDGHEAPEETAARHNPTLEEMRALDHVRRLVVERDIPAEAKLIWVEYVLDDPDYKPAVKRAELRITVTLPTGERRFVDYLPMAT